MGAFSNRFFLQLSNKAGAKSKRLQWSKKFPVGRNNFDTEVTTICEESGVKGSGLQDHMSNHGLSFYAFSSNDSGDSESSIILRTSHTTVDALAQYHNLQSVEFLRLQFSAFNSNFTTLPFTVAELDAFSKSKLEYVQHSEVQMRDSHVSIKCGPLPGNCTVNAFLLQIFVNRHQLPLTI